MERVVPFVVQLLGGFFGSLLAGIYFWPHFKETGPDEGNSVGLFAFYKDFRYNRMIRVLGVLFDDS